MRKGDQESQHEDMRKSEKACRTEAKSRKFPWMKERVAHGARGRCQARPGQAGNEAEQRRSATEQG